MVAGDDEQERKRSVREKQRARRAKEGGSSEIDSRRARRRRVVGSSRVTSGRAGAAPGSCGVCRRLRGCCCTSTRPFCVPIRTPPRLCPKALPPFVPYPSLSYPFPAPPARPISRPVLFYRAVSSHRFVL